MAPVGSTDGAVKDGQAVAQWAVPAELLPPAKSKDEEDKPGVKLRFHAIAEFESLGSALLPVLPPRPGLGEPSWVNKAGTPQFKHGEEAAMKVEAKGLDGRKMKFIVERLLNGKWEKLIEMEAEAKNGAATAKITVKHPGAESKAEPAIKALLPIELRFHAELL